MAELNFGAIDEKEVMTGGTNKVVPIGEYMVKIMSSDIKPNSKKNGENLFFEYEIIEGEYKGVRLKDLLVIKNPSDVAVQIAQQKLNSLRIAMGVGALSGAPKQAVKQLHGKPFIAVVDVEDNNFTGRDGNEIKAKRNTYKGFKKLTASATQSATTSVESDDVPW